MLGSDAAETPPSPEHAGGIRAVLSRSTGADPVSGVHRAGLETVSAGDVGGPRLARGGERSTLRVRLIVRHLDGVLRAHRNLRTAGSGRFTDYDFKVIVAYAALGIPGAAFKKPSSEDYWRIGLLAHDALAELEELAPEVTRPIKEELSRAPCALPLVCRSRSGSRNAGVLPVGDPGAAHRTMATVAGEH